MGDTTDKPQAKPKRRSRRRRWLWRASWMLLIASALGAMAVGLLFTPVAGVILRPKLEQELGIRTEGGSLRLDLGGDIIIRDVTFRTPEVAGGPVGEASRFLTIKRGRILLWWRGRLGGQSLVRRVEVFDASVRLSKPLDDFDLNILAIEPPQKAGTGGPLPGIIVHKAQILLGEHSSNGDIVELRTLPMVASLRSSRDEPGAYDVTAFEDPALSTSAKPLRFEGSLGPSGFSGTLGGIDMADFPPSTIPLQLRETYTELALGGRTRGATVRYDKELDVLELVLDLHESSPAPAPFAEDSGISARLDLRIPVPTDEEGTLQPLIPASGSGQLRLVQRPAPVNGQGVSWHSVQAPEEPGESGLGHRTFMIEGRLESTIEDASVQIDMRLWLGGAEPLYEFEVATAEPYAFSLDTPWLHRETPVLEKISGVLDMLEPAGTVSLIARVSQVADGDRVRQSVEGRGTIRDASMRFEHFPYPVDGVSGSIELDDGQIRLVGLRGTTASGAQVLGSTIITLDQVATGVDVAVQAFGVPYNHALRQTLDEIAPEIREIILNEDALASAYAARLIRKPGQPGRAPAFALGGEADAHVQVVRQPGVDGSTTVHVDVRASNIGLMPEAFPVPVIINDALLTIDLPSELETLAKGRPRALRIEAKGARATTVAGGQADASIVVSVPIDVPSGQELATTVDVTVDAQNVPVHEALLAAVPGGDGQGALPDGPRGLLGALGPKGDFDTVVRILRGETGEIDWWAEIMPQGASLVPTPLDARQPLAIEDLSGTVRVDAEGLRGEVAGKTSRGGAVRANLRADFDQDSALVILTSEALNLECPVEDAVAVFDPDLARSMAVARETFDVRGVADVSTSVRKTGDNVSAEVRVSRVDGLRFDWLEGRLGLDNGRGAIIVATTNEGPLVSFDRVLADGTFEDEPIGRVRLRGEIPMDALRDQGSLFTRPTTLDIEVQGGRLESELLRTLASNRSASRSESLLDLWDIRGEYDALVALETRAYTGEGPGTKPLRAFELSPYDASMIRNGVRIDVPWVSGVVAGQELASSQDGPGGAARYTGQIDYITLGGDDWWVSLDGYWRADGGSQSEFEVSLDGQIREPGDGSGRTHGLPAPLIGILPAGVGTALDAMTVESTGSASVEDGRLRVHARQGADTRIEIDADVVMDRVEIGSRPPAKGSEDASPRPIAVFDRGVVKLQSDTAHASRRAAMDVSADKGQVWGVGVGDVALHANVNLDGTVDLSNVRANAGGGRIAGRGHVLLPPAPGEPARFELDLSGAQLDTERLLAAVQDGESEQTRGAGDLDLSLGLAGAFGDADSLRGRGSMRIRGGSPVELPLAIRAAVEAMNVNFGADRYDAVNGEFYIQGQTMTFTRMAVSSDSVILNGLGTVSLDDRSLDMNITSRPTNDTVFRSFARMIREAIVAIELRGTLDDPAPAPKPQALVGPLDRLRRMIQGGLTYDEWTKERLRRYHREQGEPASGW